MKILNLYAGIGGNRKLWEDVDVTAVEIDEQIATIYQDYFPDDTVIVSDAHEYLKEHYGKFDFIWSSPPCPTHSKIRNIAGVGRGQNEPVYPDMRLYQEIIFLNQVYHTNGTDWRGKWVVENVSSYYTPLVTPKEIGRHYFWSNFFIPHKNFGRYDAHMDTIEALERRKGFRLKKYDLSQTVKQKILRNCVNPALGKHIFDCATKHHQETLEVVNHG